MIRNEKGIWRRNKQRTAGKNGKGISYKFHLGTKNPMAKSHVAA